MKQTQVFTPIKIVNEMLDEIKFNETFISFNKILEPSFGNGAFLFEMIDRIIKYSESDSLKFNLEKIEGWELDYELYKDVINKLHHISESLKLDIIWNIKNINSVEMIHSTEKYDLIIGNPPYCSINDISLSDKNFIRENYTYCNKGRFDLYLIFYELGFTLLNQGGYLIFITPSRWHNPSSTSEMLYNHIKSHIKKIVYPECHFKGKKTQTSIVVIKKNNNDDITKNKIKKNNFHVFTGIMTGNDRFFIFDNFIEYDDFYFCETPIGKYKFEKNIMFKIIKNTKLHLTNNKKLCFYPYENNILIKPSVFEIKFPLTFLYLNDMKNVINNKRNIWYQYSGTNSHNFGKKILFPYICKNPIFYLLEEENLLFYAGYGIKYDDLDYLISLLNSDEIKNKILEKAQKMEDGYIVMTKYLIDNILSEIL